MKLLFRLVPHKHKDVIRTNGHRLFVSCHICGRESEGILTGGFKYKKDNPRAVEVAKTFKPKRGGRK